MKNYSLNKLPSDILSEVALKHKRLRKKHKLSQAELAERSGVSLGSIKRFEQSGRISLESLLKLAYLLDRLEDFNEVFSIRREENPEHLFSDKMRGK